MNKTIKKNIIMVDGWEHVNCPVCGNLVETYDICDVCHWQITAVYDICDVCQWQNTGETNIDGGPNEMTLAEAKEAYVNGIPII